MSPRPARTPGQPLDHVLKVRLTDHTLARIDAALLDGQARSEFVRQAVEHALALLDGTASTAPPQLPHGADTPVADHRHTRGAFLSENTVKGVTTTTYRCAHPGCTHELVRTKPT